MASVRQHNAVELAAYFAGIKVDMEELGAALRLDDGHKWVNREFVTSSANLLLMRQLIGLYVLSERILVLAESLPAADDWFHRLLDVVIAASALSSTVTRVVRKNGYQRVELMSGATAWFGSASTRSHIARGMRVDVLMATSGVVPDEALPSLIGSANPQLWRKV